MWLCNYFSNASVSLLYLSVALQVVSKDYYQETTFQIKFEHNEISLDIPENGQETEKGWRITPYTYPLTVNVYKVILSMPLCTCLAMCSVTNWALSVNLYPHQIHRKDVDNFKPGKSIPPQCVLLVEWDLEGQKPVRLRHKINFIGAKEPNLFHLSLNPTRKGSILFSCSFIAWLLFRSACVRGLG